MIKPIKLAVVFILALPAMSLALWAVSARYPHSGVAYGAEGSGDPCDADEGRWGVEIQINNTSDVNDDMVRLAAVVPAYTFVVPCQARLIKNNPTDPLPLYNDHTVVLTNGAHDEIRFTGPADKTVALTLAPPAVGSQTGAWTSFNISGHAPSSSKGDNNIVAHDKKCDGPVRGQQAVTVFHFVSPSVDITDGAYYGYFNVVGGTIVVYRPGLSRGSSAVASSFSVSATLKPDGLDTTAPHLRNLRQSLGQNEVAGPAFSWRYVHPYVSSWPPGTPKGTQVTVSATITSTVTLPADASDNIQNAANRWLYNITNENPPLGYPGGTPNTATDSPNFSEYRQATLPAAVTGSSQNAEVTYTIDRMDITLNFRDYCMIYDPDQLLANRAEALAQRNWQDHASKTSLFQKATHNLANTAPMIPPIYMGDAAGTQDVQGPPVPAGSITLTKNN